MGHANTSFRVLRVFFELFLVSVDFEVFSLDNYIVEFEGVSPGGGISVLDCP